MGLIVPPAVVEQQCEAQLPECFEFLFHPARYKVAHSGRGAAKSWQFARALLILASDPERPLRILCARETQLSIDESVHALLQDQIQRLGLGHFYKVYKTRIVGANGSEFIFKGLRQLTIADIKSLEGVDICWVEEAQAVTKKSWETLIPTIRKNYIDRGLARDPKHKCAYVGCCSEIWVSFNPETVDDDTYKRFVINPPPSAVVRALSWRDNPWFPDTLMNEKNHLEETDYQAYLHVYEGEPKSTVEGAIFAEEMDAALDDGRICSVPYDKTRPVDTYWDLGFGDATAIWFVQVLKSGWFHFIDYLEARGKSIDWYQVQLQQRQQQRGYVYGTHWLPHDAVNTIIHKRLGNNDKSKSIEMLMREAGFPVRIIPTLLVTDQINAGRMVLAQCRFDEDRCDEGLRALRKYQWGPPSKAGVPRREPLHDKHSHGSSAFMGAAVTLKPLAPEAPPQNPRQPRRTGSWAGA